MNENDILNAICDRRIVKAYWRDPSETVLIIRLHDGLEISIQSNGASLAESWLELELERS